MRKLIFTLFASTMMFSGTITAAGAEAPTTTNATSTIETVQQVSSSSASAISGTYVTKYNSNVRLDAGTNNKIVLLAKKGTVVTATHQKKYGNETWFKVNVNGTSGWVLSTLLAKSTAAVSKTSAGSSSSAMSGTFVAKYNSNVRSDAGTNNRIITLAKQGSKVTATQQKKYGSQTWYKVNVNGTSGWVLSTLLTQASASAPAAVAKTAASTASSMSGTFVTTYASNIRSDAGTNNRVLTVASKGAKVTATQQKKYGSQTWYKVNVNGTSGWILSTLLTKPTVAKAPVAKAPVAKASVSAPSNSGVVATAMALQGIPYKFGGTTTAGFDCSGFTQYVFKKNGINLSRTTLTQFAETSAVSSPRVGDLVFFANTYRAGISHVGIYIGNNQFVHSGGAKSEVRSLNDSYWGSKFHSFRR